MIFFCILWWLLLLLSAKRNSKPLYYFCIIFLSIIIGFRGIEVGPDTQTYEIIFENIGKHEFYTYPEPGWVLLNLFLFKIGGSFHFMLWISSLIILYFVSKTVKRHSPNILFSLFLLYSLYFIFYSMNIVRQIVAVSIVLYAYTHLLKNKHLKFFIYIVLATLFHHTAILALIIWPIRSYRINGFKLFIAILISFIGGFIVLSPSFLGVLLGPYAHYLASEENGFRPSIIVPFLLSCCLSILCVFIYNTSKFNLKNTLWMRIYILGIIINNLLLHLELGTRVVMYFSIVQILVIPLYIYNNCFKQKLFPLLILISYTSALFLMLLLTGSAGVYPYNNILFDYD